MNENRNQRPRNVSGIKGFSLIELVVVVLVILVIAAFTIPNALQAWQNTQLHAASAEVADLMQQTRMLAAKNNATYPLRFRTNNGAQQAYIDLNGNGSLDTGEPFIDLPQSMFPASGAPTGSGGQPTPYVLLGDTSVGTPYDNTKTLAFSPRGLPCLYDTSTVPPTCTTPAATYFVFYFQDGRPNGWSAVVVTKAGRTKTTIWTGSSWK